MHFKKLTKRIQTEQKKSQIFNSKIQQMFLKRSNLEGYKVKGVVKFVRDWVFGKRLVKQWTSA